MIDKLKNYQRFFKVQGLKFLIDDIWMDHYKTLETLTAMIDDHMTTYLPKAIIEKTLAEGVKIYSDIERFNTHVNDYNEFEDEALEYFEKVCKKEELTLEDIKKAFKYMARFFYFYSKTEFFYTDKVFTKAPDEMIFKSFGELKNSGREMLNKIFFGEKAYLNQMLRNLSVKFNIDIKELHLYNRKEIYELFNNKRVNQGEIENRNLAFYGVGDGKEVIFVTGKQAENEIKQFQKEYEKKDSNDEVRGVVANKGKVKGRIRIIVSGYDNYDELSQIMDEMQKGDILIAETTSPELMPACHKASAIITDQGGLLSHAAIVSRELGIPCIVGTGNASEIFKDGDEVEVDAEKGIVKILK